MNATTKAATIVVIEDEPALLGLLRDVLEVSGFSVTGINRPELVDSLETDDQPAVFLVDLMLPGMDGIDLAKKLREHGFADTPMIAMSASRPMLEVAARSHLFQHTLTKPFNVSSLLDYVGRYAA